jgi:hypothetical protein
VTTSMQPIRSGRYRRAGYVPVALAAFLVGAAVMLVAAPDHAGDNVAATSGFGSPAVEAGGGAASVETTMPPSAPVGSTAGTVAPSQSQSPSSPAPTAAPSSSSGGSAPQTTQPAKATPQSNASLPNGGATAPGVTADSIKLGVVDLDSSDLAPVCPRCDNGPSKKGGAVLGLIQAWTRDGLLPVNGRTITPEFRVSTVTSPEGQRNACVAQAQQIKPFLVVSGPGTGGAALCMSDEFKMQVISSGGLTDETVLKRVAPRWIEVGPSTQRLLRNYARWADQNGLLRGHKVGIYSFETDAGNAMVDAFRQELQTMGVGTAIDMRASGTQGLGSTSGSDPVAVQRFRAAGVDVAFLFTSALGFQNAAEAQAYRPKYPLVDTGYNFTDAVADIFVNPSAMDGNVGYTPKYWVWSKRNPATLAGNNTGAYCIKAYSEYTHRTLDVFTNDAELRYILDVCSSMDVIRKSLELAGPNLTQQSFIQGLFQIRNMETSLFTSDTFGPTKLWGGDTAASAQFKKARWQPSNDYWQVTSPYRAYYVP